MADLPDTGHGSATAGAGGQGRILIMIRDEHRGGMGRHVSDEILSLAGCPGLQRVCIMLTGRRLRYR